jgi:YaiO family outer membrane protein
MGRPPLLGILLALAAILPGHASGASAAGYRPDLSAGNGPTDTIPAQGLRPWFVAVRQDHDFISSHRPQWSDWTQSQIEVTRDLGSGSLGAGVFRVGRFGGEDWGFVFDAHRNLWKGAYGNARMRAIPGADLLPGLDLRLEIFQALPGGWEVSGSHWRMHLEEDDVEVSAVGAALYVGAWYLREVTAVSTLAGTSALSLSALARRFFDPPWEYLELAGGIGQEVVVLGPGPQLDVRETGFVHGRMQRLVAGPWGVSAGASYHRFRGAPERKGLSLGLIARF